MLETGVSAKTFRLNCSPVINLFPQTAEPILLDQTRYEYPVVPDVRRRNALEIFSVDQVLSSNPQTQEVRNYEPFFSYRHSALQEKKQMFWNATRRPSGRAERRGNGDLALAGGSLRQTGAPGRGHPHRALHVHQSRSARQAALRP